ncbi:hypothetical protein ACHAWC_005783 [Mediolabrus comicus]
MAKSSKRRQTSNGTSKKKQLKQILANANAQSDPLAALPSAFTTVDSITRKNDTTDATKNNDATKVTATIQYYKSPLPPSILTQCLNLFKDNMGTMYQHSSWGLNMDEKLKEFSHDDARFLIILEESTTDAADNNDNTTDAADNDNDDVTDVTEQIANINLTKNNNTPNVIGFAHFRYEKDEDTPTLPITYLYELQISSLYTSNGLGHKLMTIIELLSLNFQIYKIILTVFKCNTGAMKFYLEKLKGYEIDECSPSNFEGVENENAEYEILSKRLGGSK